MPAIQPSQYERNDFPDYYVGRIWRTSATNTVADSIDGADILSMQITAEKAGKLLVLACGNWMRHNSEDLPRTNIRLRVDSNAGPWHEVGAWDSVGVNSSRNHFISHMWEIETGQHTVALEMQRISAATRINAGHRALAALILVR